MKIRCVVGAVALISVLVAAGRGIAVDPPCSCEPPRECRRVGPVGGWNPYGGGLLHWWNPDCESHYCGPDDYCRKPLPRMCWPTYPAQFHCPHGCDHGAKLR
jgi:hypothetical protein